MGTITPRARADGSIGYTAQIRLKERGVVVFTEARTFDRRPAAQAWLDRRERELAEPGARESVKQEDPVLADVIDRYIRESKRDLGRTKKQVLGAIKAAPIGQLRCSQLKSQSYVSFAQGLKVQPQTVENYMSHLSPVVTVARPAWGYPIDDKEFSDARVVLKQLGQVGKSKQRDRRPTPDELDRILRHYEEMDQRERAEIPMQKIIVFAMFSTRRQEEITTIEWSDYERDRVLVRDMKHPGQKVGNDTWCDLPPEAARVVDSIPKGKGPIFPFNHRSISASFTRACSFLGIEDLHFHDLRHEGTSRLFEMGGNIPHVAAVTGHRTWNSLKRYTHLRQSGDRWAGWKWLDIIAPRQEQS
ncbi:site-specific integrase [Burkholderia sp. Ax-1719]|uniref:site-specific integrase n=1 Tax=Burkholderia sp. Ax-1719 TaxID=2608334 RepID=UPI001421F452|nr:site-specific integrase [Burkholderia sp. Ax-1719]NIE67431.1 site-specific integrase [Burkholderia sp. Ax-1719]